MSIYIRLATFVTGRHDSTTEHKSLCTRRRLALQLSLLVGPSGLEPPTSCLSGTRSNHLSYEPLFAFGTIPSCGGDDGIRTHDPLLAGQVLSQLSYTPIWKVKFSSSKKILQN